MALSSTLLDEVNAFLRESEAEEHPPDWSNRYNTKLTEEEEEQFQDWAQRKGLLGDLADYDVRGFWKSNGQADERGHGSDKWKKPNHPTFSEESIYHGRDKYRGGRWENDRFRAGSTNVYEDQQLTEYMQRVEPGVALGERLPSISETLTDEISEFLEETDQPPLTERFRDSFAEEATRRPRRPSLTEGFTLPEVLGVPREKGGRQFKFYDRAQAILNPNEYQARNAAERIAGLTSPEDRGELLQAVEAVAGEQGRGGLGGRVGQALEESTEQASERLDRAFGKKERLTEEQRDFANDLLLARRKGAPLRYDKEDLGQPWRFVANSIIGAAEAAPPMTAGIIVATLGAAAGGPIGAIGARLANSAFWYTQIYPDALREMQDAGLPPKQAQLAARISAAAESAIESLIVNPLAPKKLIAEPVRRGLRAVAKRVVLQYLKRFGLELAEEPAQAIFREVDKAIFTQLNEEVPDTDIAELIRKPYEATRDSFGPLLVLTLPGGVYGGAREFKEYATGEKMRGYLLDKDATGAVAFAMTDPERAATIAGKSTKGDDISRADVGNLAQVLTKAEDRKEFGRIVADTMEKGQEAVRQPEPTTEKPAEPAAPPAVEPLARAPTTLAEYAKSQGHEELPKKGTRTRKELAREWRELIASEQETSLDTINQTRQVLDEWWEKKDVEEMRARSDTLRHQEDVAKVVGVKKYNEQAKQLDQVIQLNIDLRGKAEEEIAKYYKDLTPEQKKMVDDSQKLPPQALTIADQIIEENRQSGLEAMDQEVIRNVIDNYTMRLWKTTPAGRETRTGGKFAPTTERARRRTLTSMLEGWARGKELRIKGASNAQNVMRAQIYQAMADKQLLDHASQLGIISDKQPEGWVPIEHPNFKRWIPVGKAEEGKVYGREMFIGKEGNIFQRVPMYAEPKLGKALNNVLGTSGLYKIPGVQWVTKWNAIIKATILTTSLYHHQAFLRSYLLAGRGWNVVHGWREGRRALLNFTPELELGARNGLTIGRRQDFEERYLQEKTRIGQLIDKIPIAGPAKNTLIEWRDQQLEFLFGKMGPYLKIHYYLLEYAHLVRKHRKKLARGDMTHDDLARIAANIANDDFGGLHLGRLQRNPTVQHGMRLVLLAADWTESNVRSMAKMITAGSRAERQAYRALWGRVALRGGLATIFFNFLLSMRADDDEDSFLDRYRRAWKEGHLRWLDIDVTPIYRAFGYEDEKRKYFSLIGHFRDPIKFITRPVASLKHKGSVLTRVVSDVWTATDWANRPFTTLPELLGVDDKGVYKGSRAGHYEAGEPKGGKLAGRFVVKGRGGRGVLGYAQIPSFLLYEARQSVPIQVQNAIAFIAGEADAFDSISKGLGLMTATTYPKEKPKITPEFIETQIVAATSVPPELLKRKPKEKPEAFTARRERRQAEINKARENLTRVSLSDGEVHRILRNKYTSSGIIGKRFQQWRRLQSQ